MDGGAEGALGRLRGTRLDEAAEPLQVAVGIAQFSLQGREVEVGGLVRGRAGDVDGAVEDGEGAVVGVEDGEDVGHGGEDGEPRAPSAGAVAQAKERRAAEHVVGGVEFVQGDDALGEDERELAFKPFAQLRLPVAATVRLDGVGVDVHVAVTGLDGEGGDVVGEGVEGAAAGEVELGVVPVAGEDAVADGAAVEGEAHGGAAVVEGVEAAFVVDDEDGAALGGDHLHALARDLLDGAGADESVGGRCRGRRCRCSGRLSLGRVAHGASRASSMRLAGGGWRRLRLRRRASGVRRGRLSPSALLPRLRWWRRRGRRAC